MNIFVAIGHITDAPKKTIKQETNLTYVNFQMSIPTFEGKTKYEYIPCIAFGKTAERILEIWKDKTQKFGVEGYIVGHTIGLEQDGKKQKLLKVVIKKIYYAESRQPSPMVNEVSIKDAEALITGAVSDDELPF